MVLPSDDRAFKSWMLPRVPQNCGQQWAAPDAPQGLGFTFAAPISDADAAAAAGPTNLSIAPQAGDSKGYWTMCPVFVLGKAKPTDAESSREVQRHRRNEDLVHPFLTTEGSGLARFDSETTAKNSRLLVTGPVVDVKLVEDDHLHLFILDDRDDTFFAECGVPVYAGTVAGKSGATSAAVTRQLGR